MFVGCNGGSGQLHDLCWRLGLQVFVLQDVVEENIPVVCGAHHFFLALAAAAYFPGEKERVNYIR